MSIKDDVKTLLTGDVDKQLEVIETRTQERLKQLLGGLEDVPTQLEYIVVDVSIKRFNRISNEGMQSYSQEGLSMTFPESDFDEYLKEIEAWKHKDDDDLYKPKRGKARFI